MEFEELCSICREIINYARSIKLLESSCRHKLYFYYFSCEDCKIKLFEKKNNIDCPTCRKKIFKNEFKEVSMDEVEFEYEMKHRKDVLK